MILSQLSICLFPIIVLGILYANNRRSLTVSMEDRLYNALLVTLAAIQALSFLSWLPDGQSFAGANLLCWVSNILYYLSACAFPPLWMIYGYSKLSSGKNLLLHRWNLLAIILPLLALVVFILLSPFTHALFTITADNRYMRGPLFYVPYLVFGAFGGLLTALALYQSRREATRDGRARCYLLAAVTPLPLIGLLLQACVYGLWIAWPLTTVCMTILSVSVQSRRVTMDALDKTGNPDVIFLGLRLRQHDPSRPWCLMIADVDRFKTINDRFGHVVGDEALRRTADILRAAFAQTGAFLARCGGDEFAVVADCENDAAARALLGRLDEAVKAAASPDVPYELSLSVGCAVCGAKADASIDRLIERADRAMYRQKKHGRR